MQRIRWLGPGHRVLKTFSPHSMLPLIGAKLRYLDKAKPPGQPGGFERLQENLEPETDQIVIKLSPLLDGRH